MNAPLNDSPKPLIEVLNDKVLLFPLKNWQRYFKTEFQPNVKKNKKHYKRISPLGFIIYLNSAHNTARIHSRCHVDGIRPDIIPRGKSVLKCNRSKVEGKKRMVKISYWGFWAPITPAITGPWFNPIRKRKRWKLSRLIWSSTDIKASANSTTTMTLCSSVRRSSYYHQSTKKWERVKKRRMKESGLERCQQKSINSITKSIVCFHCISVFMAWHGMSTWEISLTNSLFPNYAAYGFC